VQLAILLLLVVALGLLILGLIGASPHLIIASVVASVLAGGLTLAARRMRATQSATGSTDTTGLTETTGSSDSIASMTTRASVPTGAGSAAGQPPDSDGDEPAAAATEAPLRAHGDETVWVIDGRPRYHVAACAFLANRASEPIPLRQAVEDGFTPCALCDPDAALAAPGSSRPG
jgi:hypothetical protein